MGYFLTGNGVQLVLPTLLLEVHRHENNFLIQYVVFKFVLLRFFCIYFEYILRLWGNAVYTRIISHPENNHLRKPILKSRFHLFVSVITTTTCTEDWIWKNLFSKA